MNKYEKFSDDEASPRETSAPAVVEVNNVEATNGIPAQLINADHIEVTLVDDPDLEEASETNEVFTRASDFFLEHNDNYKVTWDEASYRISEVEEDPSRPPQKGWNLPYVRWRLRRIVENFWFRILTILIILVDVAIVIADLALDNHPGEFTVLQIIDLIFTIYFLIEIFLRILALTQPVFFSQWYNVVDFAVVLITFIVVIVATSGAKWAQSLGVFVFLRLVRVVRLVRLYTEKQQLETAARQLISQNKRRYQQDGHDLDLTYVTQRVIATSFPSSGAWALFRNPIGRVAKFLDEKHYGKYKLYNLCSERTYDTTYFHDRVERFMIDDHNVPSLSEMLRFAQNVKEWLRQDPENVIVVHCKGGKGRTGTMICVWLVEAGVFSNAEESLDYFGHRRTDKNVSTKFQGVETPSQSRYVGYFERMKRAGGVLPKSRKVVIKEFVIKGMMYVGCGNGDDFWFTIHKGREEQVFSGNIGFRRNCEAEYNPVADVLRVKLLNCPALDGDVRVLFQTSSRLVPKGYEGCPFYFWFNTAFVGEAITLNRDQLDNPHKQKTWECFRKTFEVTVNFEESGC